MSPRRKLFVGLTGAGVIYVLVGIWSVGLYAPSQVRAGFDRVTRAATGFDFESRCWERRVFKDKEGSFDYTGFIGSRACYHFYPVRSFRGIYIDEFEGQRYLDGKPVGPPYVPRDSVWLELDKQSAGAQAVNPAGAGHATRIWEINFVGRQAIGSGFGHLGMSDDLILVDRINSARLLHQQAGSLGPDMLEGR